MGHDILLIDCWLSVYGMRVKIALAEKGIEYDIQEENLPCMVKSPLLLEMNPVHKKVPVLIHNGKPICESLNIVQYVDETWNHEAALLPADPYERSQARFWADYIDKKLEHKRIWRNKGEEQEKAKNELIETLKILEGVLGEKPFFGGDALGFVDVTLLPFSCWFYALEKVANFSVEAECPKLVVWVRRCMTKESVSKSLPDPHKIYDFVSTVLQKLSQSGVN